MGQTSQLDQLKVGERFSMELPCDPQTGWPDAGNPRSVMTTKWFEVAAIDAGRVRLRPIMPDGGSPWR